MCDLPKQKRLDSHLYGLEWKTLEHYYTKQMNAVHKNHIQHFVISISYDILQLLLKIHFFDILKHNLIANKKNRGLSLLFAHKGVATWVAQVAVTAFEISLATLLLSGKSTTG